MAPLGTSLNRPEVSQTEIARGVNDLMIKLQFRLNKKGPGAYASRHEILGILVEEYDELVEAVRLDGEVGYAEFKTELLDIAVGAIYGYICLNGGYIQP